MRTLIGLSIGIVAALMIGTTLHDPGLTVDEPINTGHGKRMVYALTHDVGRVPTRDLVDQLFRTGHEHPPLARFLIGVAHAIVDPLPNDPDVIVPKGGRFASTAAFALIIVLAAWEGGRWGGNLAALAAALSVLLIPRLWAHAYLASPEVISAAFILLACVACRRLLDQLRDQPFPLGASAGAGVAIGLALLTKLTAVLLPAAWLAVMIFLYPRRAWLPLFLAGGISLVVLVGGWPWLWPLDLPGYSTGLIGTGERLAEFFRVGVDRATIYVDYLGTQFPNPHQGVPWHFAWFFFGVTLPMGTLLFGLWGAKILLRRVSSEPAALLVVLFPVFVLMVFSLPIDRYDSERLFLFVFPFWGILAGVGIAQGFQSLAGKSIAASLALVQAGFVVMTLMRLHPLGLSYFSEVVGRLPGAEKAGVELTYWGDSVTDELLNAWAKLAQPGDRAMLVPTLYAGHPLLMATTQTKERGLRVEPADWNQSPRPEWYILFRRAGYLHDPTVQEILERGSVEYEIAREGVWLARVYRWPKVTPPSR